MATASAAERHVLIATHARRRVARARVAALAAGAAAAWWSHAAFAVQAASERQPLGAAVAPPQPSAAAEVVRLVGALVVVVGIALALQWWLRRSGIAAKVQGGAFEVLARHPVGRGQSVLVARFGGRVLLLQQSREGLRTLSEVSDPAEAGAMLAQSRGAAVAPAPAQAAAAADADRTIDLRRRKDGGA